MQILKSFDGSSFDAGADKECEDSDNDPPMREFWTIWYVEQLMERGLKAEIQALFDRPWIQEIVTVIEEDIDASLPQ